MVNVRETAEIPTDGSNNIVAKRIHNTEVFIRAEREADAQGYQWFWVYEKDPDDLGWVREDVLLEYVIPPNPSPSPGPSPGPNPSPAPVPEPPTETHLRFETDRYVVRVLRVQTRLSMNIYNKTTQRTEILGVATVQLPQLAADTNWQTYLAQQDDNVYVARFIPMANTELVMSDGVTGAVSYRQAGFRAEGVAFVG